MDFLNCIFHKYIVLLLLCVFALGGQSFGQQDCRKKLEEIRDLFLKGRLQRIVADSAFLECLNGSQLPKNERLESYEILTEAFLFLNLYPQADESFERLLEISPDYKVDPNKPDMVYLYSRFRTDPVFSLELGFSGNMTIVSVQERFAIDNLRTAFETYDNKIPGYFSSARISFPFSRYAELAAGLQYSIRNYRYSDSLVTFSAELNALEGYGTLVFQETQSWIDIPIQIRVIFKEGKYQPYLFGGAAYHLLLTSRLKDLRRLTGNQIEEQQSFSIVGGSPNNPSNADLRARSNFSVMAGLGIKYKIKLNYVFMEAGYMMMTQNLVKTQNRYENQLLLYRVGYVDNDFRISNPFLTIGFARSFYNPELKRKYKRAEIVPTQ